MLLRMIVPSQMHDFAFAFVELHEVPVGPFFQHVETPLNGSHALQHISSFPQFGIIHKLTEMSCQLLLKYLNDISQLPQHHWMHSVWSHGPVYIELYWVWLRWS